MARPTKYNKEIADKFIGFISDGLPIRLACIGCDISEDSIARWRSKYPNFDEAIVEASDCSWKTSESLIKYGKKRYKRNERATKPFPPMAPALVPLLENYELRPKEEPSFFGFPIKDGYPDYFKETEPYYNKTSRQIEWIDKKGIFHTRSINSIRKEREKLETIVAGFIL